MKHAHSIALIVAIVLVLGVIGITGYWCAGHMHRQVARTSQPSDSQGSPTVSVHVAPLVQTQIQETLVAYGTVVAALGKTEIFSVPFESQVQSVLVTDGQVVDANAPLVVIAPSPDTRLSLAQARSERDSARQSLDFMRQRLQMKLTTQENLVTAQQQFQAADLKVKSMEDRGIDGTKTILATANGLISRIDVEPGQIVAAGATLVEMIGQHEISVRLGIENEDIGGLRANQEVELYPVNAPDQSATQGRITLITHRINPQTRLVDVFVTPLDGSGLMLNEYLEAHVVLAANKGLVVPRSAILPQGGEYALFTVRQGRAVRHKVGIGLETPTHVQVLADDLQVGEQVVTVGNYELTDGTDVKVEKQE